MATAGGGGSVDARAARTWPAGGTEFGRTRACLCGIGGRVGKLGAELIDKTRETVVLLSEALGVGHEARVVRLERVYPCLELKTP